MKKKRMSSGEERLVYWLFERINKWLDGTERDGPLEIVFKELPISYQGEVRHIDGKIVIYVDDGKHAKAAQNLLHEVLHEILPSARGRAIYSLERLIWNRLSEKQKEILRSFLPKKQKRKKEL